MSRVSLRTRNPALGQPDAWEHRVLVDFDRRAQSGEGVETVVARMSVGYKAISETFTSRVPGLTVVLAAKTTR